MDIGKFNKVVTFQQDAPTPKGAGNRDVWEPVLVTRGRLDKSSGVRALVFGDISENSAWTLYVRKQAALETIKTSWRVLISGQPYTIDSWELVEQRHWYYKISINLKRA